MHKLSVKDIALIALFAVILTVQEELLVFIPSVNFTIFLIVLFSKCFGCFKTILIVTIYVILDNMYMGNFSIIWIPFMYIGWIIIPIFLNTVFKHINESLKLAILGVLFSFIYCWIYLIPNAFILNINIKAYLIADVYFEIVLAATSFVTILWLYNPAYRILKKLIDKDILEY